MINTYNNNYLYNNSRLQRYAKRPAKFMGKFVAIKQPRGRLGKR